MQIFLFFFWGYVGQICLYSVQISLDGFVRVVRTSWTCPDRSKESSLTYYFNNIIRFSFSAISMASILYVPCGCLARPSLFGQPQHCTHSPNIYYPSYIILGQRDANCICYMINMNGRNGEGISYGVQRRTNMTRRRRCVYGPERSKKA